MQARKLLAGAAYGPETLKVITRAFDDAWAAIQHQFDDTPLAIEIARLSLASAILNVAKEDSQDSDELTRRGLQAMAIRYRIDPALKVVMGPYTPKYWRAYAEEMLTIAEQMNDPECKRMVTGIAETYTKLAHHAAAREAEWGRKGSA